VTWFLLRSSADINKGVGASGRREGDRA
jgi:hypothetical protein